MTEMITSPANEKLKRVRKLSQARHRRREGLFVTEGEDLLQAGLRCGIQPLDILAAAGSGIDGDQVDRGLLDEYSALGSGTRVIAVWRIPEDSQPSQPPGCVFLDGVGDPGNVGTIVRTAAALTGARVVTGPGSADPYSPKSVRASMGAVFSSPPISAELASTPEPRLGLLARGGERLEVAIGGLGSGGPATLCLGAERSGLSETTLAGCVATATIALRPGSESLNVAASAAIALQRISSLAAPDQTPREPE